MYCLSLVKYDKETACKLLNDTNHLEPMEYKNSKNNNNN